MIINRTGVYEIEVIEAKEFYRLVTEAEKAQKLRSYIGYPDIINAIGKQTGIKLNISRKKFIISPGDELLVMKKKYTEGKYFKLGDELKDADYEYLKVKCWKGKYEYN
jgi:hypothetical protein